MKKSNGGIEKIYKFSGWILVPILGLCSFLFSKIRVSDFSSPYLNDWISINLTVCLFWAFFTIAILLIISIYYQIKSIILEDQSSDKTIKSNNYSKRLFIIAFEFFNLMIISTVIFTVFTIVSYFICPFIFIFSEDKERVVIITTLITTFIVWFMVKKINKTKVFQFFKNIYTDCIFLVKKFRNIWMLYLAVISLLFPFFCYRFELQTNKEIFIKTQDSVLITNITLGGMTSSSNYYNRLRTYLVGDNLKEKIILDFVKFDKMKFRSVKELFDLPPGNYKIISFYKRQLMFLKWDISREKIFRVI